MLLQRATRADTVLDRLDPRIRVLVAVVLGLLPIALTQWSTLLAVLLAAMLLCALERIPMSAMRRRILAVNSFMLALVLMLPWSVPGDALAHVAGFTYSRQGLHQALVILLRCNAALLMFTALIATMEAVTLAHALDKLRCPSKLVHLFMFTLRYLTVLEEEYHQLRQSMTLRGFRPRLHIHTLRTYGNLVGMMLVRALDRSERIMEAMLCRGYSGKFYTLRHYALSARDVIALVTILAVAAGLVGWDRA
jgi:cobalt/nickel transport system permease protein